MEFNYENLRLKKAPHPEVRLKFLKVNMIRLSCLKGAVPKNKYMDALNRSITDTRSVINS